MNAVNKAKQRYLQQYRQQDLMINHLLDEKDRMISMATRTTPIYSSIPSGGSGEDRIGSAVEKIIAIEKQIDCEIDILVDFRGQIKGAIESVPDIRLRQLLLYRYIDGLCYEKIAEKTNYEERQIYRLHGLALQSVKIPAPQVAEDVSECHPIL